MATIRDIAIAAGVSRQTVSRVLNESPRVDPGTRARVVDVIRRFDYVPSVAARNLSTGRTMSVGIVVPFLARPSVVARLAGIEAELAKSDYEMLVYNVETTAQKDRRIQELSRRGRVDGLVIMSIPLHRHQVERLRESSVPTVLLDSHASRLPRVVTNDVMGGRLAARHLLALGHSRMAFVGDVPRTRWGFSSSRLRFWGFRQEIVSLGEPTPELIVVSEHSRSAARQSTRELLSRPDPPTAIFCASDTQAIGAMEAARSLGVSVPANVSIVGYDDIEASEYLDLTTVRQPLEESGRESVRLLFDVMSGQEIVVNRRNLPVQLMERRTTAPPANSSTRAPRAPAR